MQRCRPAVPPSIIADERAVEAGAPPASAPRGAPGRVRRRLPAGPPRPARAKAFKMKRLALRTLQIASAVAISILGGLIAAHSRGDLATEAIVIALIGLSLIGIVSARLASPASFAASVVQGADKEAARQAQDHLVDAALQQIIKLIRDYVILNSNYHDDLSGLNSKLLQLPSRNDVQDIIVKLISTNLAMQMKVLSMAKELEASQLQIVSLRNNISEVGKIAMIDALTELGNRRFFDQILQKEIERARETGAGLCLALADIDRFKAVNDRFGHLVGDHLLKLFAASPDGEPPRAGRRGPLRRRGVRPTVSRREPRRRLARR